MGWTEGWGFMMSASMRGAVTLGASEAAIVERTRRPRAPVGWVTGHAGSAHAGFPATVRGRRQPSD
jgi:hypothetical protein